MAVRPLSLALAGLLGVAGMAQADVVPEGAPAKVTHKHTMMVRTYSVADLVVPLDSSAGGEPINEENLITIVCRAIAPDSWENCGGRASIQYYALGKALVIRQSAQQPYA